MTKLMVLRPDVDPARTASRFALAPRAALSGARLTVIGNGKPRAAELLGTIGSHLVQRYGLASCTVFGKAGASQVITDEQVHEIAASADVVLTGLGDCGGCSACSLQDALLMERAGIPSTVVVSEPFQGRVTAYAAKLGVPAYGVVVVPHPVSSRSAAFLADAALRATEPAARQLGTVENA
ncbi:MAG: hypothetical protein QOE97_565 [Pseudonocardiales bacterium]|jgi:hypothetical protein|nr:hypothetical protein [Pseudonocardiales bacterium]